MSVKRLPRPRDPAQLAKLIVDIATGEIEDQVEDGKNPAAVKRGEAGGAKGGTVRASRLTPEQRVEAARLVDRR